MLYITRTNNTTKPVWYLQNMTCINEIKAEPTVPIFPNRKMMIHIHMEMILQFRFNFIFQLSQKITTDERPQTLLTTDLWPPSP